MEESSAVGCIGGVGGTFGFLGFFVMGFLSARLQSPALTGSSSFKVQFMSSMVTVLRQSFWNRSKESGVTFAVTFYEHRDGEKRMVLVVLQSDPTYLSPLERIDDKKLILPLAPLPRP